MKSRILANITWMPLFATLTVVSLFAQGHEQQKTDHSKRYVVTDLGTLGGTFGVAYGVNNKGWVDGVANLAGDDNEHGFLWVEGLKLDLGTFGGPNSIAGYPPNEKGQIAGIAETDDPDPLGGELCDFLGWNTHLICLPFIWENGVKTRLPTLDGYNGGTNQINNRGQIAGMSQNTTIDTSCPTLALQQKPVLYEHGGIQELPTFPGDPDGFANSINHRGQIVGSTGNCTLDGIHGLLWQNGTVTDLGNLGGTFNTIPFAINSRGQVVGMSNLHGDTTSHAFLWEKGTMTDLGTLPRDFSSAANWINYKGQMVGQSCDVNFNCRAVIWEKGVMSDLNSFVHRGSPLYLLVAFDINSRGQVSGFGLQSETGAIHAFVANPCNPEDTAKEGCEGQDESAAAGPSENRGNPTFALPESVRKLLQPGLRFGRRGKGAQ